MIMRDKAVRWCDGEIKSMIKILRVVLAGEINGESVTNYVRKSRNWYRSLK